MGDAVLEDLKEQLQRRRVVLVVGSGISIAATKGQPAASWKGLLRLGVERCADLNPSLSADWKERALADVSSSNLEELLAGASKVSRTLRKQDEWSRWLADTIGKLVLSDPEPIDALGRLNTSILTTNYDDLIDRHLERSAITWKDSSELIAFTRLENHDTILHLHGIWRDADSVILDVGDYERILGHPQAQASLRTMAESATLLFVGCGEGMTDPNFGAFLDWIGDVLQGARHRHYRLELAENVERLQEWHTQRNHRVQVLAYGDQYADLPEFISDLLPSGDTSGEPEPAAAAPSPPRARPKISAGEYVRLQHQGREAVGRMIELATQLGWTSISERAEEISRTLEQDLYRVAITGRSRAGKSTLVNVLVRRMICPVQRTLTTALPIIIGPGEREWGTVTFEKNLRPPVPLESPITADMLAPWADQKNNPGNEKKVEKISIRLGHDVLDLGVEYIDIPGFDDPSERVWSATQQVVEKAHALVLVFDASTAKDGGFHLDRETKKVVQGAHKRGAPVFFVCNKSEGLSGSQKKEVEAILMAELGRLGIKPTRPWPPFFVSARGADEARTREEVMPGPFQKFEDALWESLWNTDAVGLRRLHTVFKLLHEADEEASALIAVRDAKGPVRDLLLAVLEGCRADEQRIRAALAEGIEQIKSAAKSLADGARSAQSQRVANHVAAIPRGTSLPTVSATLEQLHPLLSGRLEEILVELTNYLSALQEHAEKAVSRSLAVLRKQVGVPPPSRQVAEALEALAEWTRNIGIPDDGSMKRQGQVFAAGAAFGLFVGGPAAWVVGGLIGLISSAIAKHITDHAKSHEDLLERAQRIEAEAVDAFSQRVLEALQQVGEQLDTGVQRRIRPFVKDMRRRLEQVRELTEDELRKHAEVHKATEAALNVLTQVLGIR